MGLFTSISPNFLSDILGINNKMIMGSFTLVLGGIFVCLSLIFYSLLLLVIGAIVSGIGQAFSFRGGLSLINSDAPKDKHSEITSTFFTIVYIGPSIPVIGLGLLGKWLVIQMAGTIFSVDIDLKSITNKIEALYLEDAQGFHYLSMYHDLKNGRLTEICFLNDQISDYGNELRIPTPVNSMFTHMIHQIEN
ncbi:ketopantoate reductase C-terminal domain-containing protein [Staphylococcus aureus]|uniref:ketopantoate reductase C-terminal domain-containing protein n=1 Tax=Staphylococcus aureus TaxID=1280 RepID=UPI001E59B5BF|nr:ketopantoate reductase C-terminal domain-containing protein [Staphylococcus aureus]